MFDRLLVGWCPLMFVEMGELQVVAWTLARVTQVF